MRDPDQQLSPIAIALRWAYQAMGVASMMVVPGVLGFGIDYFLNTGFVFGIVGFVVGMCLGIWHLIKLSAKNTSKP